MLRQHLVGARSATCPVQLNVSSARCTVEGLGVTGGGVRADREIKLERYFPIEVPDQANNAALPATVDVENDVHSLMHLKGGGRQGWL